MYLLALAIGIQFVAVERTNPEVVSDFDGPPEIEALLRRACYDCHSNETVWPWYSKVAPMSWMLSEHVLDGRKHLNFSEWDEEEAWDSYEEIGEAVASGEMPLKGYLLLHGEAKLSDEEKTALLVWCGYEEPGGGDGDAGAQD